MDLGLSSLGKRGSNEEHEVGSSPPVSQGSLLSIVTFSTGGKKYDIPNIIKELPEEESTPTNKTPFKSKIMNEKNKNISSAKGLATAIHHVTPHHTANSDKPNATPTTNANPDDELERIKLDKRKRWEQEMQQELNRIDSNKLRDALNGIEKTQEKQAVKEVEHLEQVKIDKRKAWELEMEAELARLDSSKLKGSLSELNQEKQMEIIKEETDRLDKVKLEKRKKWEMEMQNELKRISTDKLKDVLAEMSVEETEDVDSAEESKSEKQDDNSVQLEDMENVQNLNKTPIKITKPEKSRDELRKKASINNQQQKLLFKDKRITFDENTIF
jgi:hypothetical protein